jgi:flagellar protein FlaG
MAVISPITTQAPVASTPMVGSPAPSTASVQQKVVPQQASDSVVNIQKKEPVVTEKSVQEAVNTANQMLANAGSNETISFAYEEKLNQLYVKIVDQNSGAVVREIPSKDFIRHQIALREMIGLILDKKA